MKIFITGASGFLGSHLALHLLRRDHDVIGAGRNESKNRISHRNYRFVAADTTRPGEWQKIVAETDAVLNLAGQSIFGRWSEARKKQIRESRILTTRNVVSALAGAKPATLVNASGAGYYGDRGDDPLTENEPAGEGFMAQLAAEWEGEALKACAHGHRVVMTRLGIVLGKSGGALTQMIPAFKAFMGGPLGSGRQWFPWVHEADLAAAVGYVIEDPDIKGAVNLCSPNPVRHRDLARALGKVLGRPAVMPAPAFILRLVLGEFAGVLLGSQRTLPEKLVQHRFQFRYVDIVQAFESLVRGNLDQRGSR